jgi:threonine aldolase
VIAGVQLRTLSSHRGELDPEDIRAKIRAEDLHFPNTGLICLENAHSNGRVIGLATMKAIYELAREHDLPVHLDGARLFNAAAYLGAEATDLTQYCDSVMFCLSKGLCAPVGSMLAGKQAFIEHARKGRKLMGGGLRQAGFLAAAGLVALKEMRLRLDEDHQNALLLGRELATIPGIQVLTDDIHINLVYFDIHQTGIADTRLVEELRQHRILANPAEGGLMRFATHHGIGQVDVQYVSRIMKEIL